VAAARDDDAAQVGESGEHMAITAFPALAPRLRSVAYPDNFKPNIQKYDGRSDPNIWLSTYYIAVKAAGGNFDHMAVADTNWRDLFGDATLHHLVSSRSDHCPLFLEIRKEYWARQKVRILRYEIMWERLESLAHEIKEAWCTAPNRV
jgi:hypothetical protein